MTGTTHPHVDPPPIPLIKENNDGKPDKDFVKLKLCRYPTLPTYDLYELRMSFFDNVKLEEFLLLVCNFNMTLAASGTLEVDTKFQYLFTLVCREALRHIELLSADIEGT